jgi:mevalonate kinase
MAKVCVSAPGKVILHGEHAVVFGKTAIAVSVGLRTKMEVKAGSEHVILLMPDLNKSYSWSTEELLILANTLQISSPFSPCPAQAEVLRSIQEFLARHVQDTPDNGVIAFLYLYLSLLPHCPPLCARVVSDIPIGAGLGSSAAMSVCFASGLLLFSRKSEETNGLNLIDHNENVAKSCTEAEEESVDRLGPELVIATQDQELICSWAFMSEKIMHGTPSGIDNSVATYGGVVTFSSGTMTPQPALLGLNILLTNTCVGRNTRQLVAAVRKRYDLFPGVMVPVMDATDKLSLAVMDTLQACRDKNFTGCEEEFRKLEVRHSCNYLTTCTSSRTWWT